MTNKIIAFLVALIASCCCLAQPADLQRLKQEAEQAADTIVRINALNELVKKTAASEPQAALKYGLRAVALAQQTANQKLLANSYHNVGAVYQLQGNYQVAADYSFKALHIREAIGDSAGMCVSYNNIGNINNYLESYEKALQFYRKSLEVATRIKNKEGISRALNNLGYYYETQKNLKESLRYYEQALPIKEEIGDKTGTTVSLINIGDLYIQAGNPDKGISFLQRGLDLALEINHRINAGYAYRGLAEAYQEKGNLTAAIEYSLLSLQVAREHNSAFEIKSAAEQLNSIYSQSGDYQKAHQFLTLAAAYKDSLHNEKTRSQIEELQVKYETEIKEKENIQLLAERELQQKELKNQKKIIYLIGALLISFVLLAGVLFLGKQQFRKLSSQLVRKNAKISKSRRKLKRQQEALLQQALQLQEQKELLEKSNKVKDKLFSIVAHDLRSPLVSLRNMTQLLRSGALSGDRKIHFLELVEAEQQNALWLIDNLFAWASAQMRGTSITPKRLHLAQLTTENFELLQPQARKKAINLYNRISTDTVAYADSEMIKLVLRNLITNAIKFCRPGDNITLTASRQSDKVLLAVEDTGVGIPEEYQKKLFVSSFTSQGTAREKGSGLGLQLCKEFVELHGGTIWVSSEAGQGSTFMFTLPAEPAPELLEEHQEKKQLQATASVA